MRQSFYRCPKPLIISVTAGLFLAGCAGAELTPPSHLVTVGGPNYEAAPAPSVGMIYFASDKSDLRPDAKVALNKLAALAAERSERRVTIEGHADERGTDTYNFALASRRVEQTRAYLIANGIAADRIHTEVFGKNRPAEACGKETCWSKNRRVQVVVSGGGVGQG